MPASGRAAADVRAAIDAAGGAIPWSTFMDVALYGPHGFYTDADAPGTAGRRGDFITSPEVGPLFGVVIGRYLDAVWDRLGRPDPFTVVDAGAGPGTLARSVVAAGLRCADALRYVAVEASAAQRGRHPAGVESRATMPDEPIDGVVLANELLDNLPFRLAVHDGVWREAFVTTAQDGSFVEVLSAPFDPVPAVLPTRAALGARAPLQDTAAEWVTAARSHVRRGTVLVIDYARARTAELAGLDRREWLRTYRGHERGSHHLADPGEQDITVDIAVDQLPEPDAVRSQHQFLQLHGIGELVEEGRLAWHAAASRPDLRAMTMRSRVAEAEALLDPHGLGGFTVLEWSIAASPASPVHDVSSPHAS
jgi:SAM-dependent MidA family methyltransferase